MTNWIHKLFQTFYYMFVKHLLRQVSVLFPTVTTCYLKVILCCCHKFECITRLLSRIFSLLLYCLFIFWIKDLFLYKILPPIKIPPPVSITCVVVSTFAYREQYRLLIWRKLLSRVETSIGFLADVCIFIEKLKNVIKWYVLKIFETFRNQNQ